jgi:hypothetical protein
MIVMPASVGRRRRRGDSRRAHSDDKRVGTSLHRSGSLSPHVEVPSAHCTYWARLTHSAALTIALGIAAALALPAAAALKAEQGPRSKVRVRCGTLSDHHGSKVLGRGAGAAMTDGDTQRCVPKKPEPVAVKPPSHESYSAARSQARVPAPHAHAAPPKAVRPERRRPCGRLWNVYRSRGNGIRMSSNAWIDLHPARWSA